MAQINSGDWPIDPASTTGNDLADLLNRLTAAVMSGNSGTARPPNIAAGMVWTRANANGTFDLMLFRGSADTTLMTVSATGAITPGGTYTSTQIDNKLTDLKNEVLAATLQTLTAGSGIAIAGSGTARTISHSDTSSVTNLTNSGGTVIQSLTFDTFGHVLTRAAVNLDNRYYTQATANGRFVINTGDTMTGRLTINTGGITVPAGGTHGSGGIRMGSYDLVMNGNGLYIGNGSDWFGYVQNGTVPGSNVTLITRQMGDARYAERFPSAGEVGSYAFCRWAGGVSVGYGTVVDGAYLYPVNASGDNSGPVRSGTWRCMGYARNGSNADRSTLWLRLT